jgi:hypothetical protein
MSLPKARKITACGVSADEETKKRTKVSGPSGKNTHVGVLVREERDGQIDGWRAAASRAGLKLPGSEKLSTQQHAVDGDLDRRALTKDRFVEIEAMDRRLRSGS